MEVRHQDTPFGLRMPKGMREKVRRSAAENGRSMNAEIIFHIRRGLGLATGEELGRDTPAAENDEAALAGGSL